jgi:zinc transporter
MSPFVVPGFIYAFRFDQDHCSQSLAETDIRAAIQQEDSWIWLHLNLVDWRCRRWLCETFGLPRDTIARFADPPTHQNISAVQDMLSGHFADFLREFDGDSSDFAWLHFIKCKRFLITGRLKAVQSAERIRDQIAAGHGFRNPDELLSRFLSSYTDRLDQALHRLTDELELIEDHVLDERHRGERRRLMLARRETAQLHRHMRAMRRVLQNAQREDLTVPEGFALVSSRLANLDQDFADMESRARFFHDEIDAKLAAETNRQLYTLSALTAAFLPPTLVAGLFGMNLNGMPFSEQSWGFGAAVALCVLSSGAVILYLRVTDRS